MSERPSPRPIAGHCMTALRHWRTPSRRRIRPGYWQKPDAARLRIQALERDRAELAEPLCSPRRTGSNSRPTCEQSAVRTVLSRAARAAVKRGEPPRKKTAITLALLEAMFATCADSLEGLRDRALLCFGFANGGRRRNEIAEADLRDLRRIDPRGHIVGYFQTGGASANPAASTAQDRKEKES